MPHQRLSPHAERALAVAAGVDPRTVRAFLAGRKQHSTTAARIERALRELNLTPVGDPRPATEPQP